MPMKGACSFTPIGFISIIMRWALLCLLVTCNTPNDHSVLGIAVAVIRVLNVLFNAISNLSTV